MTLQKTVKTAGKIGSAHLLGGTFYACWMSAFLLLKGIESPMLKVGLWLIAPLITSLGFTVGIVLFERRILKIRTRFLAVYPYLLLGTAGGALAFYWMGPMLIVFGMFIFGTAGIFVREAVNKRPTSAEENI